MTPAEFDQAVRDLVAFMTYMGEPIQLERLGWWVLGFLAILFVFCLLPEEGILERRPLIWTG